LSLGGTLTASLVNGFLPQTGTTFDILDWTTLSGTFDTVQLPTLGGRIVWNSSHLYDAGPLGGTLSVAATYYQGDVNRDSLVNVADISALMTALSDLSGYQSTHPGMSDPQLLLDVADVNGDGNVTNADIQALINLLANNAAGGAGGSISAVPEPPSLILLAVAGVVSLLRRRQHA
jgi:hypothetical protein